MASPFVDILLPQADVHQFINTHKSTVANSSKRVSDYFEMGCFNDILSYYEKKGYVVTIQNLQNGRYRYKCSTAGIQSNFSYFRIAIAGGNKAFEIHHNLAAQSSFDPEIFTTPDISVIAKNSCQNTTSYYESSKIFSFVANKDLMTFCECKHFTPFPELLFNFMGTIHELFPNLSSSNGPFGKTHIAPSLMISGKPNNQAGKIKDSLERRFHINIIFDLFYSKRVTFSRARINRLRTI